ncbi:EH domain-containing protein 1, partial [Coemansia sp. RSA 2167]
MDIKGKGKAKDPSLTPAGSNINVGSDGLTAEEQLYQETVHRLQKSYSKKIKPLEQAYCFEGFHSAPLTAQDIGSKPMILLLGQYSTGKTTFVEYLLGESYPGAHVGIEPTTDRFVAIMNGPEPKVIPGHAAAVSGDLPFSGLTKFGTKFLSRFQVAQLNNPLLSNLTLIDTPGILSGSKQIQRGYDFTSVINWFAERSDLVLLLFDGYKLDISDEFKGAIQSLRGHEDKVRIVLNKCDQINQQQLMRVYGALMWSLGKVIPTPEVNRVYLGSFWPKYKTPVGTVYEDNIDLLISEQRDLLRDL